MSATITSLEEVPLAGSCILADNALTTASNNTITFPSTTSTLATAAQVSSLESRLNGASGALVFDTQADMNSFLADSANTATLTVGQNLYIRQLDVPDYWWDGTQACELETQKVDLTEIEEDFDEINSGLTTVQSKVNTMSSNVTTINSRTSTMSSNISTISSNVTSTKSTAESINSSLSSLENSFTSALVKAAHPIGSVMMRIDSNNPRNYNGFGDTTWSNFGNTTVGSYTIYYFRRTA